MMPGVVAGATRRAVLAAGGLIASAACGARADSVVITGNGPSAVVVINGQVVSGGSPGSSPVVAKGPPRTETRAVPAYSGLQVDAPAAVTFSPAAETAVTVTAPANILPLVETTVRDGTLVIGMRVPVVLSAPITVAARGPNLTAIGLAGAGRVKAAGLSGPGLAIALSGSGVVAAEGRAARIGIRISGAGDVDVAGIRAAEVSGVITGSGTVRAFAAERIAARITGSGTFIIFGDPAERETRVTGAGEILFR